MDENAVNRLLCSTTNFLPGACRTGGRSVSMLLQYKENKPERTPVSLLRLCRDDKRAFRECPVHRVSANDIDRIVQNQIEIILNTPTMLAKLSLGDIAPEVLRPEVSDLRSVWANMFPAERRKLARVLITKILVFEDEIRLVFHGQDIATALAERGINCEVENAVSGQEYVLTYGETKLLIETKI